MDNWNQLRFTWSRWRSGSPLDFFTECRTNALIAKGHMLREYAIAYCNAKILSCRPKRNHKAVMFYKDGEHFWFHLSDYEFDRIFKEVL
ncbi:hypothetical protein [uncultured Arcobacter sp.]|uniref:hypothetical protein n=1 Tax=uncultured Arcobacter sp. TaxID=165434 RepID=UPI002622CF7C|nr:hypothetical protein [uncultured Arcobacter sp.]